MTPAGTTIPLTFVIPVFGRQASLDRALDSIAAQDAVPECVIVVDDGSRDPLTVDRQRHGKLAIRLLRNDINRGAAAARNVGLRAATTDWVSFLDSDDQLVANTLGTRWSLAMRDQAASRDSSLIIYGCGWTERAENATPLGARVPRPSTSALDFASGCWFSPGSCVLINRRGLAGARLQDETLRRLEDLDWFLALALEGYSLHVVPVVGASIERRRVQDPKHIERTADALYAKWAGLTSDRRILARMRAYLDLEAAAAHFYGGSQLKSLTFLARSFFRAPRWRLQLSPGWSRPEPPASGPSRPLALGSFRDNPR